MLWGDAMGCLSGLQVVTGLQWARAESSAGVPVWVVVLAVLLGLLLLALLSYGLYKVGVGGNGGQRGFGGA